MGCVCSLFADSDFFGAAMGISESFLSLGWIVGPLLGGYAADVAGFAAPFILTGALAFLATPVLYFLMPAGLLHPPDSYCTWTSLLLLVSQRACTQYAR